MTAETSRVGVSPGLCAFTPLSLYLSLSRRWKKCKSFRLQSGSFTAEWGKEWKRHELALLYVLLNWNARTVKYTREKESRLQGVSRRRPRQSWECDSQHSGWMAWPTEENRESARSKKSASAIHSFQMFIVQSKNEVGGTIFNGCGTELPPGWFHNWNRVVVHVGCLWRTEYEAARCFLCPAYSKSRQTDHSFDESPLQLQLMDSTGSGDTQPPTES